MDVRQRVCLKRRWRGVSAHSGPCDKKLVSLAEKAVRRVEASSEMQQQFDESELKDEWHGVIKDLLDRLASKQV